MKTTQQVLESASRRVMEAERLGMSATTINKRYRALFAAQDAAKAAGYV